MGTFFTALLFLAAGTAAVCTWVAPFWYYFWRSDNSGRADAPIPWRGTAALALLALVVTSGVIAWGISSDKSSAHQWEGGNGPNTKCSYQQQWISTGKTGTYATYTVCQ